MEEIKITKEYYDALKRSITEVLGDSFFTESPVNVVRLDDVSSFVEEDFYPGHDCIDEIGFVIYIDSDEEVPDATSAEMSLMEYRTSKGPGRTAVMLYCIHKTNMHHLIPALVVKCARDLYDVEDMTYWDIEKYASKELEEEGFNPQFIGKCKRYLDTWTYDINKRFLGDENGEYLWENARKNRERLYEDPELLAEYYALYFKETFENNKVVYYRHDDGFKRAMIRKIAEKMNNAL